MKTCNATAAQKFFASAQEYTKKTVQRLISKARELQCCEVLDFWCENSSESLIFTMLQVDDMIFSKDQLHHVHANFSPMAPTLKAYCKKAVMDKCGTGFAKSTWKVLPGFLIGFFGLNQISSS